MILIALVLIVMGLAVSWKLIIELIGLLVAVLGIVLLVSAINRR